MTLAGRKKFEGAGKKPQAPARVEAINEPLRYYYQEIKNFTLPTLEETQALARIYATHKQFPNSPIAENARKGLVESHLRLAHKIAHGYYIILRDTNFKTTTADLVQAANLGLLKAIERYNPEKGKFISFACHYMRAFALQEISKSRIVRIPPRYLVRRLEAELLQIESMERRGKELNKQQLNALMERKERIGERINAIKRAKELIELDAPLKDVEELSLLDTIEGPKARIIERTEIVLMREKFRQAIAKSRTLKPTEKRVLEMRVADAQSISNPPTFEEIARVVGLRSRQRAEQVFNTALNKLEAFPELRQFIKAVKEAGVYGVGRRGKGLRIKAPSLIQAEVIRAALRSKTISPLQKNILQIILAGEQPTAKELSNRLRANKEIINVVIRKLRIKINNPAFESLFKE